MKNDMQTREQWLERAVATMSPHFKRAGYDVPQLKVSCGWPSKGALAKKKTRIGECWDAKCSGDKLHQIFISPRLHEPASDQGVLATLVHEVVHAVVGLKAKHGAAFRKCARAVGLFCNDTATTEN